MLRTAILIPTALLANAAFAQSPADPLAPLTVITTQPAEPQEISPNQPDDTPVIVTPPAVPVPQVIPKTVGEALTELSKGNWEGVRRGLGALPDEPLKYYALAQLYTAKGSPKTELPQILDLLSKAPDLPQAEQLARMAMTRGATATPAYAYSRPMLNLGSAPKRGKTRSVTGDPVADTLRLQLDPLVKIDDGPNAELAYLAAAPTILSPEARAEAAQRVAWIYYVAGRDDDARRMGELGRAENSGEWAGQSAWISGLASWRLNDCATAFTDFADAARLGREPEFVAAANFWAARAAQACRRPAAVNPLLLAAARSTESFYGLLARETLGMDRRLGGSLNAPNTARVANLPNLQRARALLALGRRGEAEAMFRHQARIGNPADHRALIQMAEQMALPGAQYWLAHFGPAGASSDPADRYPMPQWTPQNGWRIDAALAYAHCIQESNFRTDAVSPAGAVGLMQVRPGTAGDTARARGTNVSSASLKDPLVNIDYGQAFIELIRSNPATQGQLPKVIAAYNAGPVPVSRWSINDRGDPLLWIESIPYWETRYYVPSVLRNMWVINGLKGESSPTLTSMVQHRWPSFPTRNAR
nr:transglycosylase SLT domain-containing protein [uncultured Sphingomonas sp.]